MKRSIAAVFIVQALACLAQPPIQLDWIQDDLLWDDWQRGALIGSYMGRTTMYLGGALGLEFSGCGTHVTTRTFEPTGELATIPFSNPCMDVVGISQSLCGVQLNGGYAVVAADIGGMYPQIWVSGLHVSGWTEPIGLSTGLSTFSTCSASRALLISGDHFYFGGISGAIDGMVVDCSNRIWKEHYPVVDAGPSWTTCLSDHFLTFEIWGDTLLAVGAPIVTKVDRNTGTVVGSFDLFEGVAVNNISSAISGDTLF